MAGKPTFVNRTMQIECIRGSDGQPLQLKATSWVNPKKDDQYDQEKLAACDKIRDLVLEHDLSFRIQFEHRNSEDYNTWPKIGAFNLFSNRPYDENAVKAPAPAPTGGFSSGGGFSNG